MAFNKIIDISLPLTDGMVVYPGNPEVSIKTSKSSSGLTYLSQISFGSHTGTHIDAPRHVAEDGLGVGELALKRLIGPCRVFDFTQCKEAIKVSDISDKDIHEGERILAKTRNSLRGVGKAYDDYIYCSSDAAGYLAKREIALFGIDYLSVKKRGSTDNRPHTEFLDRGIPIIEAVDLAKVEEGEYTLVALPLRFVGLDGAPARVVLLK